MSSSELLSIVQSLREMADTLEEMTTPEPPWIDRIAEMPINSQPFHADFVSCFQDKPNWPFWPIRNLEDVTGLTIHHTMSHSPLNTARYCAFTKGYPAVQYHWWVSADDGCPVYLLADPTWRMWHDCTGAYPTTLAIGMAGHLDQHKPPTEQLEAAARLCAHLMHEYDVPLAEVQGHRERWNNQTQCPGWGETDGNWKHEFYEALESELEG